MFDKIVIYVTYIYHKRQCWVHEVVVQTSKFAKAIYSVWTEDEIPDSIIIDSVDN